VVRLTHQLTTGPNDYYYYDFLCRGWNMSSSAFIFPATYGSLPRLSLMTFSSGRLLPISACGSESQVLAVVERKKSASRISMCLPLQGHVDMFLVYVDIMRPTLLNCPPMLTFRTCGMPRYRREGAWARQGNRDSRYLSTLVVSPEIERDQDHSKCGYRRKPFLGPAETRSSAVQRGSATAVKAAG